MHDSADLVRGHIDFVGCPVNNYRIAGASSASYRSLVRDRPHEKSISAVHLHAVCLCIVNDNHGAPVSVEFDVGLVECSAEVLVSCRTVVGAVNVDT